MNRILYRAIKTVIPDLDDFPRVLEYRRAVATRDLILVCEVCSVSFISREITLAFTRYERAAPVITRQREAAVYLDLDLKGGITISCESSNVGLGPDGQPQHQRDETAIAWIRTLRAEKLVLSTGVHRSRRAARR